MNLICSKEKNREKIEKMIQGFENEEQVINQVIWDRHCGKSLQMIYNSLKDKKYVWEWYSTDKVEPEIVQPGALQCPKCSDRRIKTRTRQTRSGDEGQTVFAGCSECKYQWVCTN